MLPIKLKNYSIFFIHFYTPKIFIVPCEFMWMPIFKSFQVLRHSAGRVDHFQHYFDSCYLVSRQLAGIALLPQQS